MTKQPLIRLKRGQGRRVRAGAPWVFSNEIEMDAAAKALAPGSLVRLADEGGTAFATGYFNPKSLIAVRVLAFEANVDIGAAFFEEKLRRALALRERFYAQPYYRLVHAEGDGLPGLIIDRFGEVLTVQIGTAGMEMLLGPLCEALEAVVAPQTIVLRNDAPSRAQEGLDPYARAITGEMPGRIAVEENGVRYFADMASGQKTGWYYDQRDNRAFIANLSKGKTVLDACCYSGGFALAAARAGAEEAIGIDSSQAALVLAEEAANANGLARLCKFIRADLFEELERLGNAGERFDIVLCDPPPFVKARKDLEAGARGYRRLARLAAKIVAKDGLLLLASCSHNISLERFAQECAAGIARSGRNAALVHTGGAGADHPVHPLLPETAYLKALVYAVA